MKALRVLVIGSAVIFFALAVWYGRPAGLWNSPDETANAFWAERVARGEPLLVHDAIVGLGAGTIHPRSMAVAGDALVPGSFTGLIFLYGALRMVFKLPLFLFTPILTLIAGGLFAVMIGRLFDRRVGLVSGALFFLHPAVTYYAARGLFHNVLFLDLLIFSAACFTLKKDRVGDLLGGFLLALAIFTRASEALWALPAFALLLPFAGKARWQRFAWAALGALLPLFLMLQVNTALYGSPLRTPYVAAPVSAPASAEERIAAEDVEMPEVQPAGLRLPFGFDAAHALRNAWHYGIALFWWQSLLAVAGLAWWLYAFRQATRAQKTYALAAVLTAIWLAVLYGSWAIRDRLDFQSVTIGTSYVRYFLPAYAAMLPFAALAIVRLSDLLKRQSLLVAMLAVVGLLTVRITVFSGDESLRAVRATLEENAAKRAWLLGEALPPDAVVMTERFDKLIVPDRLRIIPIMDDSGFNAAALAARAVPVFWYGLTPSPEERARLEAHAARRGLRLVPLASPARGESFYALELL